MTERKIVGDSPTQEFCAICGVSRALTGEGKLFTLAVRGPRNTTYVKMICEECVGLFNTRRWPSARNALRQALLDRGARLFRVRK